MHKMNSREIEALACKVIPLDAIEQKVIHLRICNALNHRQISTVTGLSEKSVNKILENVVRKIRDPHSGKERK